MRAVIDDRRADHGNAVEQGERGRRLAALVQIHHDLAGQLTVGVARDAEANDVERHRRAHLESLRGFDIALQALGHAAGLLDALAEFARPEGFDGEPGL